MKTEIHNLLRLRLITEQTAGRLRLPGLIDGYNDTAATPRGEPPLETFNCDIDVLGHLKNVFEKHVSENNYLYD